MIYLFFTLLFVLIVMLGVGLCRMAADSEINQPDYTPGRSTVRESERADLVTRRRNPARFSRSLK